MAELRALRQGARPGPWKIVSITGEAGIGKSRLKNELPGESATGRALARGSLPGLHPDRELCAARPDLESGVPTQRDGEPAGGANQAESDAPLARRGQVRTGAPAVAHLLGMEGESVQSHQSAMDPRALQSQLVLALRSIVEALVDSGAGHPSRRGSALGGPGHHRDPDRPQRADRFPAAHDPSDISTRSGGWLVGLPLSRPAKLSASPHRTHTDPAAGRRVRASGREPVAHRRVARGDPQPNPRAVRGQSILRRGDHPYADRGRGTSSGRESMDRGGRREPPRDARHAPRLDRGPDRPPAPRGEGHATAGLRGRTVPELSRAPRAPRGRRRARSIARPSLARRTDS